MLRTTLIRTARAAAVTVAATAALAIPATAMADPITPQTTPDAEINAVNPSLLQFWQSAFQSYGLTYRPAAGVVYYDYNDSNGNLVWASCGGEQIPEGVGGEYCPSDNTVYIDYSQDLQAMNDGSYTVGALYSHEIGHAVQDQLKINLPNPYNELQADCLSGMYTRWAVDNGYLTTDDAQQGVDWAYSVGGGGNTGRDMSHGTQYDRGLAWTTGYTEFETTNNHFDATACNSVAPREEQLDGDPDYLFPIAQTGSVSSTDTTTTTTTTTTDDGSYTGDSGDVINQLLDMNTDTSIQLAKMLSDSASHNASIWLAPECDSSYNGCL